ncbi:MAG: hypothetical protein HETSPECPRED_009528 [Heterodermia speciosa]|uniref:Uncharacterized protein n=1 Tax=Heterodermia speciosa TaxID=116794 RepID=A0A8H3IDP2_9LECA|nr:MAG: hypothetical protein HETSPECPRED_009528 [Heterodermia speciosa]
MVLLAPKQLVTWKAALLLPSAATPQSSTGFDCADPFCAKAPSCKKDATHQTTITSPQIASVPGDGKPQCPHVCNSYPICICLPSSSCDCAVDNDTPTGNELEGSLIPAHGPTCAQVCTKEGFCICVTASNCTCGATTSNWSPFDLIDAPADDPVFQLGHNSTQPGEGLGKGGNGNGTHPHHVTPCSDICDEHGNCGCDVGTGKKA